MTMKDAIRTDIQLTDCHSHFLPCIDDGASSIEESIKLLEASAEQGVGTMIATPHFYADANTLECFIGKRQQAWESIRDILPAGSPKILLGAEVYYFDGISSIREIDNLRIADTGVLLLEMPFMQWTGRMISEILELHERNNMIVMLAHIERYIAFQKSDTIDMLHRHGVVIQSNAEFFVERKTRRKALKMFKKGEIDVLGSDCHNTHTRPQEIGTAVDIICDSLGEDYIKQIQINSNKLFNV